MKKNFLHLDRSDESKHFWESYFHAPFFMETLLTYFVIVAVGMKMGGKGDPFISLSKVMKNLTGMYNFDEIYWSK